MNEVHIRTNKQVITTNNNQKKIYLIYTITDNHLNSLLHYFVDFNNIKEKKVNNLLTNIQSIPDSLKIFEYLDKISKNKYTLPNTILFYGSQIHETYENIPFSARKKLEPTFKNLVDNLLNQYLKNNSIIKIQNNQNYKILEKESKKVKRNGIELLIEEILFK